MKIARSIALSLLIAYLILSVLYILAFEISICSNESIIMVIIFVVLFTPFIILQIKNNLRENKADKNVLPVVLILMVYGHAFLYIAGSFILRSFDGL